MRNGKKGFELGFHSRALASIRGSKGFDWKLKAKANREWTRIDANESQRHCTAKAQSKNRVEWLFS